MPIHKPVMPAEVLNLLDTQAGQVLVDGTLGGAGHTRLLAERVRPGGRVIALDVDPAMIAAAKSQFQGDTVTFVHAGFEQLRDVLNSLHIAAVDGFLADLGICSDQLDDPSRGFSFQTAGPLDMRLDRSRGQSARDLLATLSERDLADVIWRFGEERHSRRIARRIVEERRTRRLETTEQLAELVRQCVPRGKQRIDPATRTFQALRIAVNDELASLETLLKQLPRCLKPGGRAAIISFHSLEDRLVKHAFRDKSVWQPLTKKPVTAGDDEVRDNPRARSAKLRAAIRLPDAGGDT